MSGAEHNTKITQPLRPKLSDFSEILKLLKKILSTRGIISKTPVSYFKSNSSKCINQINHGSHFVGDEVTADVSTDDHQLLAYHFHIPESLCGKS